MGRKTERFINATNENLNHEWLIEMFLEYLKAEGKSPKTLKNYESDLRIFFTWYEKNATLKGKPKGFEKIKVQDIIKLQAQLLESGMSINRYSRLKSVISSNIFWNCFLSKSRPEHMSLYSWSIMIPLYEQNCLNVSN